MQLFQEGDIIQMRDKSQWEIISGHFEHVCDEFVYEFRNIHTRETDIEVEVELNRRAIVIRFSDKIAVARSKVAKVYQMSDYRKQRA